MKYKIIKKELQLSIKRNQAHSKAKVKWKASNDTTLDDFFLFYQSQVSGVNVTFSPPIGFISSKQATHGQ